jgi:hypothetical protein
VLVCLPPAVKMLNICSAQPAAARNPRGNAIGISIGLSVADNCYGKAVANVAEGDPRFQPPSHGRQRRLASPATADWHQSEPQTRAKYPRDWAQVHASVGINGG